MTCTDMYGETWADCGTAMSEPQFRDCWIDRNGRQYYVPDCGHEHVARAHRGAIDGDQLERQGWIHFSTQATTPIFHHYQKEHSQSQIDTLFDVVREARSMGWTSKAFENQIASVERCIAGNCDPRGY